MEEKDEGFVGLKWLKKGNILVGKSKGGGVCTPPPTWTLNPNSQHSNLISDTCHNNNFGSCSSNSVTARQLGANLWEILPYLARMNQSGKGSRLGSAYKNKGLHMQTLVEDPLEIASDDQPESTGSFHRQIAASLMRHHQSVDRNGHAVQPVSPASYTSSMEITPYDPAATPSSSLDYKGKFVDPSNNLKTSSELLKVLNRIWCLEEQHASNVSLMKTLKTELDNARTRIKQLLREKHKDRQVIDELMKQVAEHKLVKKNMEQDRVQYELQSVREELEDERKLRKRSESMHRKMAREISDTKSSFSKALNELERERRARILLEDLCDQFALGIREYEQDLRLLQYRNEKEHIHRNHVDSLVLHVSEAWLDERVQMKLAEEMRNDVGEKCMIVDKLRPEIETFLKARQTSDLRENVELPTKTCKGSGLRRQSLESFPLNEATSAPQNADEEDDIGSADSEDSHCFELNKNVGAECLNGIHTEDVKNPTDNGGEQQEVNNDRNVSSLQARFEKHTGRVISISGKSQEAANSAERNTNHNKAGNQDNMAEEVLLERRSKRFGNRGGSTIQLLDNLLRTNSSSIEGDRIYPVTELGDESHGHFFPGGHTSPVKKWDSKITSQDSEILEGSSRWSRVPKENSLKAKLLEARLEGRNSQLKGSKGS